MKKYLHILMVGAMLMTVSCQVEQPTYEINDNIKIVSQDLVFSPQGGNGTIVVEAESAVTATADRPWCTVTVSGMNVAVTVPEWNGKENRYAKITIQSGKDAISVTAQQFGEVIGGLDMTDVTSPAEGSVKEFKYVSNLPVSLVSNESWIHIAIDEELQVVKITIDKNTEAGTRAGVVNYTIGGHSGTFNVLQYPETILVQDGWTATVVDGGYEHPKQFDVISMQATNPAEKFVWAVVDKSKVTDVADYAFSVVAVEKKNEIMAKVESGQLAS
ncbi:MAG: BACON domain-containing protein, partial [Bacteroidales bacterium]|nr:BACON domain-containing protein [Bacteroidales bacterium]